MRRRSLVLLVLTLAVVGAGVYVVVTVSERDTLGGVDVDAVRAVAAAAPLDVAPAVASDAGPPGAAAPSEVAPPTSAAPALPTLQELAQVAEAAALVAHVTRLEAALGALGPAEPELDPAGQAQRDAERGELHVLLSTALRQLRRFADARAHADMAVALAPASSVAHHARARALAMALVDAGRRGGWTVVLRSLGDVGECKGELAAAVALDPLNLDARDEELAIYLYAPWPIGGAAKARECIEALAALDPVRGELWRAQELDKEDRTADALARVEALAARSDLTPEDRARVALSRGQLLQTLDRFQDAAAVYAALGTGPRTTTWYLAVHERARCCQRGGFELEAAIELLDEFIAGAPVGDFMPELSSAWYRKGLCLRDLGRRDEARLAFEATLALDPDHDRARDELRAR